MCSFSSINALINEIIAVQGVLRNDKYLCGPDNQSRRSWSGGSGYWHAVVTVGIGVWLGACAYIIYGVEGPVGAT